MNVRPFLFSYILFWTLLDHPDHCARPTNITDMPVVHFTEINFEQNHQSGFLHHGHPQYHCFVTYDGVKFYHDTK